MRKNRLEINSVAKIKKEIVNGKVKALLVQLNKEKL